MHLCVEFRAYQNNISGEIVVVFRGTELSVTGSDGDLAADFDLVNNSQFSKAKDFYREVANKAKGEQKSISYIAGHSLGGALATYVGIDNNVQTYAFNAPPISNYAGSGVDSNNPSSHSNVINIISSNDPISSLSGSLAGSTIVLDVDTVFLGYMLGPVMGSAILGVKDHSIDSILDELRRLSDLDPNEINGYIFNIEDGKWYLREAVPDDRIPEFIE